MAGYTPFQFSSTKLQNSNAFNIGANAGLLGDLGTSLLAWYEMWVNPESVNIADTFNQTVQHTAGAIVTHHYRKNFSTIQVSGKIGWVAIQSLLEESKNAALSELKTIIVGGASGTAFKRLQKSFAKNISNPLAPSGASSRFNNSPRLFLQRLKDLAYEPVYYYDSAGMEHYNTKYIKMFTKQYPDGVICEGYFENFEVPEAVDDGQTILYNFTFVVENIKPVTLLQRIAGMFSDYGSAVGEVSSLVTGFF
jgi:hypothetical protein